MSLVFIFELYTLYIIRLICVWTDRHQCTSCRAQLWASLKFFIRQVRSDIWKKINQTKIKIPYLFTLLYVQRADIYSYNKNVQLKQVMCNMNKIFAIKNIIKTVTSITFVNLFYLVLLTWSGYFVFDCHEKGE